MHPFAPPPTKKKRKRKRKRKRKKEYVYIDIGLFKLDEPVTRQRVKIYFGCANRFIFSGDCICI